MGAMPQAGLNRFGSVESAKVVAALEAIGSHDPDVVYAAKQRMLQPYRDLRRLAVAVILLGCALIFIFAMPLYGLVAFGGSAAIWRFQSKQVANVESGCATYLAVDR